MKTKKAFTLPELLIAIAISTVLLLALGAGALTLGNLDTNSIESSKINYQIVNLKDFIKKNEITDDSLFTYNYGKGQLSYNGNVLYDMEEVYIYFIEEDGFIKCTLHYQDGNTDRLLKFVVKEAE